MGFLDWLATPGLPMPPPPPPPIGDAIRYLPAPAATEPRPLIAGPITAWRCWTLRRDEHGVRRLASIGTGDEVWTPGAPVHAWCKASHMAYPFPGVQMMPHHDAPGRTCQCGAYGLKSATDCEFRGEHVVYGEVALWGRVVEHEKGYRAQYAYPLRLYITPPAPPMPGFPVVTRRGAIERVARLYGITAVATAERSEDAC